jgi:hypothetical protein
VAHLGVVLMGWRGRGRARRGSSVAPGAGHCGGGKISGEPGRIRAMRGRGGVLGVLGGCGGSWMATDGQGGRAHRAALMVADGGVKQRVGRRLVRRGRSSGRLLFMVDMRTRPATTCAPPP